MDEYQFGYPSGQCRSCDALDGDRLGLRVRPYFTRGPGPKVMFIGQDPTIARNPERVNYVLMLDQKNSRLSKWLTGIFGADWRDSLTVYATNLVKCSFRNLPGRAPEGAVKFLEPYFRHCSRHFRKEIYGFQPRLVLTFGEPAHKFFLSVLDKPAAHIPDSMKAAFTGRFVRASCQGVQFDYSPCLHITTFRVAQTYGETIKTFQKEIRAYCHDDRGGFS